MQVSQSKQCRLRVTVLNETSSPDGEHKVGGQGRGSGHGMCRSRARWHIHAFPPTAAKTCTVSYGRHTHHLCTAAIILVMSAGWHCGGPLDLLRRLISRISAVGQVKLPGIVAI